MVSVVDVRPSLPGRVDSLDGLRTIAVLMVFGYHATSGYFLGGSIGVDIFFGISGFVITLLLMREYGSSGRIRWGRFTLERLTRLWPALLLVCGAVAVGSLIIPAGAAYARDALVSALYSMNFWRAFVTDNGSSPLGHTWSLAVEEQFYLIWPLLFLLVMRVFRARMRVVAVLVLAVIPVVLRLLLWNDGAGLARVYNVADTRADQLLVGCALALALGVSARLTAMIGTISRFLLWPALVALVAVALFEPVRSLTPDLAALHYTVGYSITAVLTGVVVVGLATNGGGILARLLGARWLSWPGRNLSYGVYLWHYPLLVLPIPFPNAVVRVVVVFVLTVGLAYLSYRFVETPLRRRVHRMLDDRPRSPAEPVPAAVDQT